MRDTAYEEDDSEVLLSSIKYEEEVDPPSNRGGGRRSVQDAYWKDALLGLALVASALSVALSAMALGSTRIAPTRGVLRRPNAYIGLERVEYAPNTTFQPIINFPLSAFQIDTGGSRHITEDDRRWHKDGATVVPEERHIVVSKTRSTVMQFRAIDWGMEKCELQLESLGSCATSIDVWDLGDAVELVPHIAWDHALPRQKRLGRDGTEFHCASGSFPTFELVATSNDCAVDVWQNKVSGGEGAVHLKQYWSRGSIER